MKLKSIGGCAVMTRGDHERASDRCAEALITLEKERKEKFDIVVMIQGDEPMVHPQMINDVLQPILDEAHVQVVNLLGQIQSEDEFNDRNCIKVVCDLNSDAIYFSRHPIPLWSTVDSKNAGKQVCLIPFRRDFLIEYSNLEPTPLEICESIDMLRVLEHGGKVRMVPTTYNTHAVDTIEDLEKVEGFMRMTNSSD